LRTKKGWTGPKEFKGELIEDNNLSHGIPLKNPAKNKDEFDVVKTWLESYKVNELIEKDTYDIITEIKEFIPKDALRIGINKHSFGATFKKPLVLPDLSDHALRVFERGKSDESRMIEFSEYIRDIFELNKENKNFRLFSPDESESNMLESIFSIEQRAYIWPLRVQDKFFSKEGRIIELLSENVLLALMQGYNLTGRHGILVSYEAFLNIVSSQIDQYLKYLKQWEKVIFRSSLPSLNLVATSTLWRQEHNGFTHQNPTLINSLITKYTKNVSVYFPADANILLVNLNKIFKDTNKVNLIVACKRDIPQWLKIEEAQELVENGYQEWKWLRNDESGNYDVTLTSAGDYQTNETLEAIKILNDVVPEIKLRYVNVNEISPQGIGSVNNPLDTDEKINRVFGEKEVIFNFHGYPTAIKQLTWGMDISNRMTVLGYIEEGSTTTPFDIEVLNKASRFHVCISVVKAASKINPLVKTREHELLRQFEDSLKKHTLFIQENGVDLF
jgi:xylulose-5-phosphate/fructose-6-phosphate phosphoketolase